MACLGPPKPLWVSADLALLRGVLLSGVRYRTWYRTRMSSVFIISTKEDEHTLERVVDFLRENGVSTDWDSDPGDSKIQIAKLS